MNSLGKTSSVNGSGSVHPTVVTRVRARLSGGGWRSVRVRRATAAVLVLGAAGLAVADYRSPAPASLVVAAHDLQPGTVLTESDLGIAPAVVPTPPDGALADPRAAVGRRVTGPIRRGELLTENRLLTSRLPAAITGLFQGTLLFALLACDTFIHYRLRWRGRR